MPSSPTDGTGLYVLQLLVGVDPRPLLLQPALHPKAPKRPPDRIHGAQRVRAGALGRAMPSSIRPQAAAAAAVRVLEQGHAGDIIVHSPVDGSDRLAQVIARWRRWIVILPLIRCGEWSGWPSGWVVLVAAGG